MSDQLMSRPEPDEIDGQIHSQLQTVAAAANLRGRPAGEERCDNCRYYLEPGADLSYCWHPTLRILVGDAWWCQWWSAPENDAGG